MRLSPHCFAATALGYVPPWSVNAGFVAGAETTLVVDTGPTALAARTVLGYAASVRPGNRLIALNTEQHFDHLGGNAVFREQGIPVYGHRAIHRVDDDVAAEVADLNACIPDPTRRALGEAQVFFAGTRAENPNHPISSETTFDLGGLQARVLLTPGHTPTNLSVYVPADAVLFCGDCVVSGYLPNLAGGGPDDRAIWLASLDAIEALRPRVVVPGHGPVLREDEVAQEIRRVRAVLEQALAGKPPAGTSRHSPDKESGEPVPLYEDR